MNNHQQKMLYLVVTGAPLTQWTADAVATAELAGWRTAVIASPSAESWLAQVNRDDVRAPVLTEHRDPNEAKRLPLPDVVLMAPATFNSVNKLATGIADTYALSVMCEALSRRVPTVL
ncbi:MAG: flavoprotein, partial [Pseudonocardiaceae bacterium]|nr:flavoprotein [Pseudonocardiaceae bacterium]